MPHGIAQCYLPPDRGDIPALTPAEAGTRSLSTARSADRVARIHLRQLTFANMTRSKASLAPVKSRLVLPFWYRLTRVYSPRLCVCYQTFLNVTLCFVVWYLFCCSRPSIHVSVSRQILLFRAKQLARRIDEVTSCQYYLLFRECCSRCRFHPREWLRHRPLRGVQIQTPFCLSVEPGPDFQNFLRFSRVLPKDLRKFGHFPEIFAKIFFRSFENRAPVFSRYSSVCTDPMHLSLVIATGRLTELIYLAFSSSRWDRGRYVLGLSVCLCVRACTAYSDRFAIDF